MTTHTVLLYVCSLAVIVPGIQLLGTLAVAGGESAPPPLALLRMWRRPVPVAAVVLVAVMVGMGLVQTLFPAVIDGLERRPGGGWWRVLTAMLVQSSGWFQLLFNLAALIALAPVGERMLGRSRMLLVYVVSGVASHVVSVAGWSPYGAGNSVAICGLAGALATLYALHGDVIALRRMVLLIPAAGLVLCLLSNNHGVGLLVGCVLGATPSGVKPAERRLTARSS